MLFRTPSTQKLISGVQKWSADKRHITITILEVVIDKFVKGGRTCVGTKQQKTSLGVKHADRQTDTCRSRPAKNKSPSCQSPPPTSKIQIKTSDIRDGKAALISIWLNSTVFAAQSSLRMPVIVNHSNNIKLLHLN